VERRLHPSIHPSIHRLLTREREEKKQGQRETWRTDGSPNLQERSNPENPSAPQCRGVVICRPGLSKSLPASYLHPHQTPLKPKSCSTFHRIASPVSLSGSIMPRPSVLLACSTGVVRSKAAGERRTSEGERWTCSAGSSRRHGDGLWPAGRQAQRHHHWSGTAAILIRCMRASLLLNMFLVFLFFSAAAPTC
jgi:hypothetical protein